MGYMVRSLLPNTGRFSVEPDSRKTAFLFSNLQQPEERDETSNDDILLFEPDGPSSSENKHVNLIAAITVPGKLQEKVNVFHRVSDKIDNEQLRAESQKVVNLDLNHLIEGSRTILQEPFSKMDIIAKKLENLRLAEVSTTHRFQLTYGSPIYFVCGGCLHFSVTL